MRRPWLIIAILLVAAIAVVGCPRQAPPKRGASAGRAAKPGLYELGNGKVRAVGTLRRVELEGGFWALDLALPGVKTDSHVVALLDDKTAADPAVRAGAYVEVSGTRATGTSVRMYGPEIKVTSVRLVKAARP